MAEQTSEHISLAVENIGGISHAKADLSPGVNVLPGENATNRTSLLKALSAAQGNRNIALKGDQSEGSVELSINGKTYTQHIYEKGGELVFEGEQAIDSEHREVATLFAFLFEDNLARQTIRTNGDLWDVVMQPVDLDAIEQQIADAREQRSDKETELAEIESLQQQLPALNQRRTELKDEIEQLTHQLEAKQEAIANAEQDLNEAQKDNQELEQKVSQLRAAESELETTTSKIDSTEQTIERLEQDLEEKKAELTALSSVDNSELTEIESELNTLHDRLSKKETMLSKLQSIIQFNKEMVEDNAAEDNPLSVLASDDDARATDEDVTEQLLDTEQIVCWTCGTKTSQDQISNTIDQLQTIHEDIYGEREYLRTQIEERQSEQRELEEAQERRQTLESAIADLESQIERNETALETLTERKDEQRTRVETVEDEIESLREEHENEVLELREEAQNLEIDLQQAEDELASVTEEIEMIETEGENLETLEREIEALTQRIDELQQRVDQIEQDIVEKFNENMDTVLEILDYDNIERVWIERRTVDVKEGRRTVEKTKFDLHVIRESEDGTAYEDTIDHLSESEREVTGLIFSLAGYLVFDVAEKVPFVILDSLEAVDSRRIGRLIEFFSAHAENIAVALLAEDAATLEDSYNRVTGF